MPGFSRAAALSYAAKLPRPQQRQKVPTPSSTAATTARARARETRSCPWRQAPVKKAVVQDELVASFAKLAVAPKAARAAAVPISAAIPAAPVAKPILMRSVSPVLSDTSSVAASVVSSAFDTVVSRSPTPDAPLSPVAPLALKSCLRKAGQQTSTTLKSVFLCPELNELRFYRPGEGTLFAEAKREEARQQEMGRAKRRLRF